MTNEWGPPLTGEEMRALKGRIDPAQITSFQEDVGTEIIQYYKLPANHPYYNVREYNKKHGTNLVLHDGSDKVPDNFECGLIMFANGGVYDEYSPEILTWNKYGHDCDIIAYTPKPKEGEVMYPDDGGLKKQIKPLEEAFSGVKVVVDHFMLPKESEATEEMPSDEAIEYVLREYKYTMADLDEVKARRKAFAVPIALARLIQQYEPERLKPAVDAAAGEYAEEYAGELQSGANKFRYASLLKGFKAGAAWQKENGK